MNSAGEQEPGQIQHDPAGAMLSQAVSLSSQPSLPSLPSLGPRDQNVNPALHQCLASLRAHSSSYVSSLAVDGDSLYIASSDGRIRAWPLDAAASRNQDAAATVVAACDSSVKCLLAAGDGLLLSSHQDGKIRAWRANAGGSSPPRLALRLRAVLPTCADRLRAFLAPWSYVQVRRHRWCAWVHHADAAAALAVSPDGALLYSASWDRSLKAWRLPGFRCAESVAAAHDDAVNAVAVSPDGHVYTGSADKKIKAWRREREHHPGGRRRRRRRSEKHVLVQTMERHRSAVNALALGLDGNVLYSGACDRSVVVWERAGGGEGRMEATGTLRGHKKAILCLAAAGDVVCSGSADRTVRVWRRGAGSAGYTCLAVLEGHGAPVKSLALVYGRDGSSSGGGGGGGGSAALVCSGALDGEVKIWSVLVPCLLEREQ
ncbi:unnamed protein product [Urochloa decumbens]|uniref:Uncharacterized protein n=1 Tax=Urochloa decumbens TaxID=240449 RepID=A0ABC8V770_9POAL